ncbi:MAG: hypothetical protein QXM43_03350 [Desulfurococcaceae archaeon]
MLENTKKLERALKIIGEGNKRGVAIRLIGGLAIYYHCPTARNGYFARAYGDIDLFSLSSKRKIINELMEELGYKPNKTFNMIHGERRLIYYDETCNLRVDYLLDFFEMCHKIDLRNRLEIDDVTISLADLLLTKLQIIFLTEKDIKDIVALLLDHELSDGDEEDKVNVKYIAKLCSKDWGLQKTINITLDRVLEWIANSSISEGFREKVISRIDQIRTAINTEQKSLKWKLRAIIGEKVKWYELPEEPLHDSSIPQ